MTKTINLDFSKRPSTRKVKVSDCQLCGGTIHKYINNVPPRGMGFQQFMDDNPTDSRIPLMRDMIAMDKKFREKLQPLIDIKEKSDKFVRDLLEKLCDEIIIVEGNTPYEKRIQYVFKKKNGHYLYNEELKKHELETNYALNIFIASEIDITPIYCDDLPVENLFPDDPNLRNPLKGFILPLD